jgi:hypothetical protein
MRTRLGVLGAASLWVALAGGGVLAVGDATNSGLLDAIGGLLLTTGVLGFFVAGARRARQEGIGIGSALARSGKDALRLAWYVFKSA